MSLKECIKRVMTQNHPSLTIRESINCAKWYLDLEAG